MTTPIPAWATRAASRILTCTSRTRQEIEQVIADTYQRETQVLTCAYCGHAYPPGTPASQADQLSAHIRVCEKHPMRELERELATRWSPATQAHYERIEARLGIAEVVIGNLYAALDGLRDRYVPNDAARPEVAAADQALDQCRRFFPDST